MPYRPEGWENPYVDVSTRPEGSFISAVHNVFEQGADAMLKALREQHPCYIDEQNVASIHFPLHKVKGYLVFIPAEED